VRFDEDKARNYCHICGENKKLYVCYNKDCSSAFCKVINLAYLLINIDRLNMTICVIIKYFLGMYKEECKSVIVGCRKRRLEVFYM